MQPYYWDNKDAELDDHLHTIDKRLDRSCTPFTTRGWANVLMIVSIVTALIFVFCAYPIMSHYTKTPMSLPSYNLGGINRTGQVPLLPNLPSLIDKDTPKSAMSRTGWDGNGYSLVFSDEFNTPGRTFYPGDDPYWEAVDLHYWPTGDYEWYSPDAVTTEDGKLVITMTEEFNHQLNFKSGMIQSWNKFCFSSGYIEVSVSLPGTSRSGGFWPGVWTMGNLGRAGYGATNEGMWPYSYDSCDVGTFPNQTNHDGTPAAAAGISNLPGQKTSACTCPGEDHPGPTVNRGRSVPEIDVLEALVDPLQGVGQVSQSYQIAPFDNNYQFNNAAPATTIYNTSITQFNTYKGAPLQQAVSSITNVDPSNYGGNGYATYGFEYWANRNDRKNSFLTWFSGGQPSWTIRSASIGPDNAMNISSRIISEEPMSIIINFGLSDSFQRIDYGHLAWPAKMYVDYIRVYQRDGATNIGCEPPDYPTQDYIQKHLNAYSNPNLTTWAQAGYTFPKNRLYTGC
ncbi:glycoside hydrolase family 16 protein [Botryobasidium botryosum FD-172 SS1]|uniref:Glycoside hydrolase family 16 protein n=1 Tax=Botryobasidium botryosum (strain FD-172 SS1) TaxID=930990 RepID=A0A067MYG3_BOTB1|nr:glycoside hydrolase family 16 protein [Botryobasidium botryosum FD-172 SS1]